MRKVIDKKTACMAVVMLIALICILSIWPIRMWTSVLETSPGGDILSEREEINFENTLMQQFVSQYDRLNSIDVYIDEVEKGRYVSATITDEFYSNLVKVYVDTEGLELPGYVNIPFEYNMEVGKNYYLKLEGCRSKYYPSLESVPDGSGYVGSVYVNGQERPGRHLAARYNYRLPISKLASVKLMSMIIMITALLEALIYLYFRLRPGRNNLVTVKQAIKTIVNPLIILVFGVLMIMVFPLKIFDLRVADIIFYEIGLIITAGMALYAVNHKVIKHEEGVSFWENISRNNKLVYIPMMFSMAMAIWYACTYMNDLYDIYHTMSERRMVIWLLIMIILTLSYKEVVNLYNLVWAIGSTIFGIHYYYSHLLPDTEKEYDLHNAILKYGIMIVILGGVIVLNLIRLVVNAVKAKRYNEHSSSDKRLRLSPYGFVVIVFLAAIVIMRNTRWWGVALAVIFTVLYIRLFVWKNRADWIKIVSGGLMTNFAISLIFSLLHRYFTGYVSGRFGFLFHTVTVTAEYFTFMGAVAAVLLTAKIVALPNGIGVKKVFFSAWKEIILFGWISAYAIFTVSRTAILALGVCTLAVLIVTSVYHKKQFIRMVAVMVAAFLICFPAAFTLQRIVPAMTADPVFYVIDDVDEFVRGGASWGNSNFMCIERFVNLFSDKILGMDVSDYDYPNDYYNYDMNGNGDPYLDYYGNPYEGSDEQQQKYGYNIIESDDNMLASTHLTGAEIAVLALTEQPNEYVDSSNIIDVLSNGRITIFKSYIQELNMTGHDEMGVPLPNGEIAVHAHNTYIQVAYDHGIIVGILFVIFIVFGMIWGVHYYRTDHAKEPLALLPFAVIVGFAFAGISEWVFMFSNPMTQALMLSIAPLMFRSLQKK